MLKHYLGKLKFFLVRNKPFTCIIFHNAQPFTTTLIHCKILILNKTGNIIIHILRFKKQSQSNTFT